MHIYTNIDLIKIIILLRQEIRLTADSLSQNLVVRFKFYYEKLQFKLQCYMKFLRIYNLGCKPRTIDILVRVLKCRTVAHENVLRIYQFQF